MPYPPQGVAGVSDFLGLTDTPASYAGEARRRASVNVAEDALEFSEAESAPKPFFPETVLFNGAKGVAWEDLDIGVGRCLAYLKWECAAVRSAHFRQKGETCDTEDAAGTAWSVNVAGGIGYIWVPTDANGVVQWKVSAPDTYIVTLEAYIKDPVLFPYSIYDGDANIAWTAMSTGIGLKALAMLRLWNYNTSAAGISVRFKERNMPENPDWTYGDCLFGSPGPDEFSYHWTAIDSVGYIEAKQTLGGAHDMTVDTMAYITNPAFARQEIFRGPSPLVWTKLDLPLGRRLVLIQMHAAAAQASTDYTFKKGGETDDVGDQGGPQQGKGVALDTDKVALVWVITNAWGQIEWKSAVSKNVILTILAYI